MKTITRFLVVALTVSLLAACGGGRALTVIKLPGFTPLKKDFAPELLLVQPTKPFIEVGVIDIRITQQKYRHYIPSWLKNLGQRLGADAVIPPVPNSDRRLPYSSADPYAPFYVLDDGRTSIIQGRAIRYVTEGK